MRLPVTEFLMLIIFVGICIVGATVWQLSAVTNAPQSMANSIMHVKGNRLYDDKGNHIADWVPPSDTREGHWQHITIDPLPVER